MRHKKTTNIDELFQRKLEDFECSPKDSGWLLLNQFISANKLKRRIFALKALLTVIVVGFFTGIFIYDSAKKTQRKPLNNRDFVQSRSQMLSTFKDNLNLKTLEGENGAYVDSTNKLIVFDDYSIDDANSTSCMDNLPLRKLHYLPINYQESIIKPSYSKYIESSASQQYVILGEGEYEVSIQNLGGHLNSPFADYAPVINADGSVLYFTSRRPITEKEKKKNKVAPESIYVTNYNKSTKTWSDAKLVDHPINELNRFNSIIALSNDGETMLLYRDDKFGNGNIYESKLNGKMWSDPVKLPEPINSQYIETSASISPDGKTIYFVSNRPGGQGELDIWYCSKDKSGKWGEAKNIGSHINTPEKEEGVFIHPDGKTLYFSSKGHGGEGGYDIFYTRLENGEWSKPKNLGKSINTADDDVFFVMEANGKVGYYSSVKNNGFGEKDIYRVEFLSKEKDEMNGPKLTLFKGLVIDKETNQPLKSEIEIIDLERNEQVTTLNTNSVTGNFMISLPAGKNYGINVKKEGYLFYSDNMDIPENSTYEEIIKTVMLERLRAGSKIILKNIFYDYNKSTLRDESKIELNKLYELLIKNPELKVELSSHTDSRGSDSYNNKLSQERAQACVDYLIAKGINSNRIVARGYGKQQLINDDDIIDLETSTQIKEKLHLENRRTEFKIL